MQVLNIINKCTGLFSALCYPKEHCFPQVYKSSASYPADKTSIEVNMSEAMVEKYGQGNTKSFGEAHVLVPLFHHK